MLLADALAERKQILQDINALDGRVKAAAFHYENDDKDETEEPNALLDALDEAIDRFEDISVRINKTNNVTTVKVEDRTMTVMEAVARRESLLLRARTVKGIVEEIKGNRRYYGQRTKDEQKRTIDLDVTRARNLADGASKEIRLLDSALQQVNWTTELVE